MSEDLTDPYADIRDREDPSDPLPPAPNCITAFTVVLTPDGKVEVYTGFGGIVPNRLPSLDDMVNMSHSVAAEAERMMVRQMLESRLPAVPKTPAEVVAEALAQRVEVA